MKTCLSSEALEQLLSGAMDAEEAEVVYDHLTACPECQALLERRFPNRELRSLATGSAPKHTASVNEAMLEQCLERVRAAPPWTMSLSDSLVQPTALALTFLAPPEQAGDLGKLDSYRVLGELGRGGMGIVLLAYDGQLQRMVALKVLPPHRADERARARFVREAQAAAGLNHDHIVPVYAVANPADCPPYLVMQYIDGPTLRQRIEAEGQLAPREAARIAHQVAMGLAAAHQAGLIHRDIKPANIILERGTGRARIMDFGLVRVTAVPAGTTHQGSLLGTPEYMSPEQVRAPESIDARSDIYSLGVTLYEALTGELPFRGTVHRVLQQLLEEEPRPPRRLNDSVPRDLQTICLKCLEKEPGKRYQSALALAEDLRRFLAGESIQARAVGVLERGVKWARRRPAIAALAATVLLVTAAGFAGVTWQWRRVEAARRNLEINLYFNRIALAAREINANQVGRAEELLEECPEQLRGWEWHYLKRLRYGSIAPLRHTTMVRSVAFSPDGRHLASGSDDGTVNVYDARSQKQLLCLKDHTGRVSSLRYSPDGKYLGTASINGTIIVLNATTGEKIYTLEGHTGEITQMAFDAAGNRLASASKDHTAKVWDLSTGQKIHTLRGHTDMVRCLAFSVDGRHITTAGSDGTLTTSDTGSGQEISSFQANMPWIRAAAFSPDVQRLALGSTDGTVKVWNTANGQELLTLAGHTLLVNSVAFSPDGQRLISGGYDRTIKVWDLRTGQEALTLHGHGGLITSLAFSPDGCRIGSTSYDHTVRIWDGTPWTSDEKDPQAVTLTGHRHHVNWITFSPDSQRLASASWDGTVKVWDVTRSQEIFTFRGHSANLWGVAFSPDGRFVASTSWDGTIKLWEAETGSEIRTLRTNGGGAMGVAFSPDGRLLAVGSEYGTVKVLESTTGKEISTFKATNGTVPTLMFDRESRYLVTSNGDNYTAKLWDPITAKELRTFQGHTGLVGDAVFSPDGKRLATASQDGTVRIWDVATGETICTPQGKTERLRTLAFSPDGRHLAAGSFDSTVKIWDAVTGEEIHTLRGLAGYVWWVAFSPDGKYLAGSSGYKGKGEIKIWDTSLWTNKVTSGLPAQR